MSRLILRQLISMKSAQNVAFSVDGQYLILRQIDIVVSSKNIPEHWNAQIQTDNLLKQVIAVRF